MSEMAKHGFDLSDFVFPSVDDATQAQTLDQILTAGVTPLLRQHVTICEEVAPQFDRQFGAVAPGGGVIRHVDCWDAWGSLIALDNAAAGIACALGAVELCVAFYAAVVLMVVAEGFICGSGDSNYTY